MRRSSLAIVLLVLALVPAVLAQAKAPDLPYVTHYRIEADLDTKNHAGEFVAELRLQNFGSAPVEEVPLLLYRLFVVDKVEYQGRLAAFHQAVVADQDDKTLQVNLVRVTLSPALPPGGSGVVRLKYQGELHGYTEVWAYVHDTIAPDYSLLRLDTFFYPVVSLPSAASRYREKRDFTYEVSACVPPGLTVAAGGRPGEPRSKGKNTCFSFVSLGPTWRIDVAAAKFSVKSDPSGQFRAYVLPGHEAGAERVLEAVQRSTDYYSELFGRPEEVGYTVIEIPNGWGSQASDYYFLQSAAAFEDPKRISEVYHEIGHGFGVEPAASVQRARFFDEAFASYFESLAVRHFDGEPAFQEDMDRSRGLFRQWAESDKKYAATPIAEYGLHEMGNLSYSKGAYALFVLHQLIGDDKFRELVRALRQQSRAGGLDFRSFQQTAERVAHRPLDRYFQEWFFGNASSELLLGKQSAEEIVARYR